MKLIIRTRFSKKIVVLVIAVVAVIVGIVSGLIIQLVAQQSPQMTIKTTDSAEYPYTSAAFFMETPANAAEFVSKMDVIVVGRILSVIGTDKINSYNLEDNLRNVREGDPVPAELPTTDYKLVVERVILGENVQVNGSITLRVLGSPNHVELYPARMQMPQVGDRRIYGLGANPDGTYGLYGWWSQFVIDGDRVTHADDLRQPVSFVEATDLDTFISILDSAVTQRP